MKDASVAMAQVIREAMRDGSVSGDTSRVARERHKELDKFLRLEGKRIEGWDVFLVPRLPAVKSD